MNQNKQGGFTLFEVLIAIILFSLVVAGYYQLMLMSVMVNRRIDRKILIINFTSAIMEIIKTQNITNVDREKIIEELLSNEYKNIKNIIEKTSINIKKVQDGLFQVDVEVYWEKQTYKLSTFVYQKKEVNESET